MADLSSAALALVEALKDPKVGAKIRERIHPVSISRFINGHRRPGLDTALFLEEVTGGAVAMNGWTKPAKPRRARAA